MRKIIVVLGLLLSAEALGDVLFTEDFESDLSAWTGKSGGAHHGLIVDDPFEADSALIFTTLNSAGDMFTVSTFASASGDFLLSYDYLGLCGTDDCGGFIGHSEGLPGDHTWLGGTSTASGAADVNEDIEEWVHVEIPFSTAPGAPIHIMLEDFSGSGGVAGDAYFDNIVLEDVGRVPEPASLGLLGLGAIGLVASFRRRRR